MVSYPPTNPHPGAGAVNPSIKTLPRHTETYATISAPYNSPTICFVGTSSGTIRVRAGFADLLNPTRTHGATFALDCSHLDPNLVVSGGRRGLISTTDMRADSPAASFHHGTSATHLRVAPDGSEHSVIVAGVNDTMRIYDRRWLGRSPDVRALPAVTFPEYRNAARVKIGWDPCRETGVVVAAEGTGAVGLYSVFSGRRIGELPLDGPSEVDPVTCLRVDTIGGEALPSVFLPSKRGIVKYSCNLSDGDDGELEDMYAGRGGDKNAREGEWSWGGTTRRVFGAGP